MSKRLQVVMDDAEYDEIQEAADGARLTVSAWVRQILRVARAAPSTPDESTSRSTAMAGAAVAGPGAVLSRVPDRSTGPGPHVPDPVLLRAVMDRHGFSSPAEALDYALRRAAEPPLSRGDVLALRGIGWAGDLAGLRSASVRSIDPNSPE